jgi:hypothetical protein
VKLLLDEWLPLNFRHSFPGHDAHTAEWTGLKGKTNGELLRDADLAGYEALLTVDQGMPHRGTGAAALVRRFREPGVYGIPPEMNADQSG